MQSSIVWLYSYINYFISIQLRRIHTYIYVSHLNFFRYFCYVYIQHKHTSEH